RDVAGQFRKLIAVRVAQRFAQRLFGATAGEQVEHTKALFRSGRRVEPRLECRLPIRHLPYAESELRWLVEMTLSKPRELQIVCIVARELKLVRRRKRSD